MRRQTNKRQHVAQSCTAVALTSALVLSSVSPALADATPSLETLQNRAIAAGQAYQDEQDKANEIKQKLEDNKAQIEEIEAKLPEEQEKSAAAIRALYKLQQGQTNLVELILSADNFNDVIAQLEYLNAITTANMSQIQELAQMHAKLESRKAELTDEQQQVKVEVAAAKKARDTANTTANAAKQQAMKDAAEKKKQYEEARAQGKKDETITKIEEKISQDSKSSTKNDDQNKPQDKPKPAEQKSQQPSDDQSNNKKSNNSGNKSSGSSGTRRVLASMYGEGDGFMYGTTANGETVTPTSMGVAMKTMPLGTVIEITYNGRTVTAVVNDRGPYAANREIDLQPAVAHALGFDGLGDVDYRVVG